MTTSLRALAIVMPCAAATPACVYDDGDAGKGSGEMAIYIVAVKREHRTEVSRDWIETLRTTPGVEVSGVDDGPPEWRRVQVRATADGVAALRERVGAFCHVEPLLEQRPVER